MRVYQAALVTLKDPEALRKLAQAYEEEGCVAEGRLLRQRAALRELPVAVKAQRRAVFSRAIMSPNIEGVRKVAAAFAGEGASGAARHLRRHADCLVLEAEMLEVFPEDVTDFHPQDEFETEEDDEEEDVDLDGDIDYSDENADDDAGDAEDLELIAAIDNANGQNEIDERESADEQPAPPADSLPPVFAAPPSPPVPSAAAPPVPKAAVK
jgi:hypothetical protein